MSIPRYSFASTFSEHTVHDDSLTDAENSDDWGLSGQDYTDYCDRLDALERKAARRPVSTRLDDMGKQNGSEKL